MSFGTFPRGRGSSTTLAISLQLDGSLRSQEANHVCAGYLWSLSAQVVDSGFIVEIRPYQSDFLHKPVLHFPVRKKITIFILGSSLGRPSLAQRFITFLSDKPIHDCFAKANCEEPFRLHIECLDESTRFGCIPFNVMKLMVSFEDYHHQTTRL